MLECELCRKVKDDEVLNIPDGANPKKLHHFHKECFNMMYKRPKVPCPFCGEKIAIAHEFGDCGLLERDYIPFHRMPKDKMAELGIEDSPTTSVCPNSDKNVRKDDEGNWFQGALKIPVERAFV
jgi:hypothetical protein